VFLSQVLFNVSAHVCSGTVHLPSLTAVYFSIDASEAYKRMPVAFTLLLPVFLSENSHVRAASLMSSAIVSGRYGGVLFM
jgi:hypothetical protein